MPIAAIGIGLGTALAGGAAAGATIYGAHKQSNASRDAARIEAAGTDKALAAEREERDFTRKQFADYSAMVRGAVGKPNYGAPLGQAMQAGPEAAGQMLTFQAPNGQTMQRPAAERYHWLSKGATVVQ